MWRPAIFWSFLISNEGTFGFSLCTGQKKLIKDLNTGKVSSVGLDCLTSSMGSSAASKAKYVLQHDSKNETSALLPNPNTQSEKIAHLATCISTSSIYRQIHIQPNNFWICKYLSDYMIIFNTEQRNTTMKCAKARRCSISAITNQSVLQAFCCW